VQEGLGCAGRDRMSMRRLRLGSGGWMGVGGEFADEEFLDDVLDAGYADADGGAFGDDAYAAAVGGGVVGVGEAVGHGAAEDAGVVGLPVVVVSFADDGIGEGVEDAGLDGAIGFEEVAGILLEEGGQYGVAEQGAGEEGSVGGGVAFAEALCAFSPVVDIVGLLDSGGDSIEYEGDGIDHGAEGELVFLPGLERDGVGDVADVEVGEDAEDSLLLFEVDLGFGDVGLGCGDVDVGGGGGEEDDGGEIARLGGLERAGDLRGGESGGGDGESERTRRDGCEGEFAVGCGGSFGGGKVGLGEDDASAGDGGVVAVGDGAGDGGWWVGRGGIGGHRTGDEHEDGQDRCEMGEREARGERHCGSF
jgi:hypothetical protein